MYLEILILLMIFVSFCLYLSHVNDRSYNLHTTNIDMPMPKCKPPKGSQPYCGPNFKDIRSTTPMPQNRCGVNFIEMKNPSNPPPIPIKSKGAIITGVTLPYTEKDLFGDELIVLDEDYLNE